MTRRPFVLAIAGGSGAGKSTSAQALLTALMPLRTVIISEDHYYQDNADRPGFDPATFNFDAPDTRDHALLAAHLRMLRGGGPVDMPRYDFVTHRRAPDTVRIMPADLVVVEGTLALYDSNVRAACDYRLYLDVSDEIRLERRIRRDQTERGRDLRSIRHQYAETVRPMHDQYVHPSRCHADRIVTAVDPDPINDLVTMIRSFGT